MPTPAGEPWRVNSNDHNFTSVQGIFYGLIPPSRHMWKKTHMGHVDGKLFKPFESGYNSKVKLEKITCIISLK